MQEQHGHSIQSSDDSCLEFYPSLEILQVLKSLRAQKLRKVNKSYFYTFTHDESYQCKGRKQKEEQNISLKLHISLYLLFTTIIHNDNLIKQRDQEWSMFRTIL